MNKTKLKIKLKHIGTEPAIIRLEEKKALKHRNYSAHKSFYLHRTNNVRDEARATNLAYGYIRGKTYAEVEHNTPLKSLGHHNSKISIYRRDKILKRVASMILIYGNFNFTKEDIDKINRVKRVMLGAGSDAKISIIAEKILEEWIKDATTTKIPAMDGSKIPA